MARTVVRILEMELTAGRDKWAYKVAALKVEGRRFSSHGLMGRPFSES